MHSAGGRGKMGRPLWYSDGGGGGESWRTVNAAVHMIVGGIEDDPPVALVGNAESESERNFAAESADVNGNYVKVEGDDVLEYYAMKTLEVYNSHYYDCCCSYMVLRDLERQRLRPMGIEVYEYYCLTTRVDQRI